jgi:hypothetical protein
MNKKQIEPTPALSSPALAALFAIARKNATTEGELIAAVNLARRRNPDLAEEAARELARLDVAVESTCTDNWNDDEQDNAADAA